MLIRDDRRERRRANSVRLPRAARARHEAIAGCRTGHRGCRRPATAESAAGGGEMRRVSGRDWTQRSRCSPPSPCRSGGFWHRSANSNEAVTGRHPSSTMTDFAARRRRRRYCCGCGGAPVVARGPSSACSPYASTNDNNENARARRQNQPSRATKEHGKIIGSAQRSRVAICPTQNKM